jgi:glutamine synthetase
MPKPLAHAPGSGLHFHLSLTDAQGRPVMAGADGPMGLSAAGLQFAAGLLEHGDALAALCAPTVNSYKRLAVSESASGTTWSPVWKAMGDNNRTCLLRTVAGRLEWRLPDAACNVYAALAAVLAAGLDGIDRELPAPEACEADLYQRHAAGDPMPPRLPRDLHEACAALRADALLRDDVGAAFCDQFLILKQAEWDAYAQQVSDWELARYADGC